MPLQRTQTYSNPGALTTPSWNCDPSIAPFEVSVSCVVTGSVSYKLQYSYDTLDSPTATDSDASWIDSTDIPAGTTATDTTVFTAPVARVRLVFASGTGSVKMTMLQGFSIN
jgi:hypothetical protein